LAAAKARMELVVPETPPARIQQAADAEKAVSQRLQQDDLRAINDSFEKLAQKNGYEPEWYRPGGDGVKSISPCERDIAGQSGSSDLVRSRPPVPRTPTWPRTTR